MSLFFTHWNTKIYENYSMIVLIISPVTAFYCLVSKSCPTLSQPHGLQPSRLLCPWDFPGKNTAVGCHFLFQGIFLTQRSNRHLLHGWRILYYWAMIDFSSVQSLSRVRLFVTPWITARQASLSITNSQSSLKLTSIQSMMPSSHLILCRPLLLLPPIPVSIRVFSNESTLRMRWPKYWSFSFSIIPSKEIPGLI